MDKGLTGNRIRDRRIAMGLRQLELAKAAGISASYLNLIEHNRRRIGGKLLLEISRVLEVDPTHLSQGAEAGLLDALSRAASARPEITAETQNAAEFSGRFPGWAALLAEQQERVETLERTVTALTDRLTHDPQLAASMHEVISVVTAIRSTSAILAGSDDIDPEWQSRFHRNMYEDSQRLAESAQGLVQYLDATDDGATEVGLTLPQEHLESWLAARNYVVEELERDTTISIDAFLPNQNDLNAAPATQALAQEHLSQYQDDARVIPTGPALDVLAQYGLSPTHFAQHFGCDLAVVFRRLSVILAQQGKAVGLVACDSSGTLTFRKPIEGFAVPRYGAACPLWPLFQALSRPMSPIRAVVEQSGHVPRRFQTYAIALPSSAVDFAAPTVFQATMLIVPEEIADIPSGAGINRIGSSCRICPRTACSVRREPSILQDGF